MKRETRYELRYVSKKTGEVKSCFPRSDEQKQKNLDYCKAHGIKVLSCRKLYPFASEKNQHNFFLVRNVARNLMGDMDIGEIPYNQEEYDRLEELAELGDKYLEIELPVAWLTWEDHKEATYLVQLAIEHRANACIEAGHLDLLQYCY